MTHFAKVPEDEARAFLPDGWPASCHVLVNSACPTEGTGTVADLWWLSMAFDTGSWAGNEFGAGSIGFILVETRAPGDMHRPRTAENHEFVHVAAFTDQLALYEWLELWNLTPANGTDIEFSVVADGLFPSAWVGGASAFGPAMQGYAISGDAGFATIASLEQSRNDDMRIFLFDPSAGEPGPRAFLQMRASFTTDNGGAGTGTVTGTIPGFSDTAWTADATWVGDEHSVTLTWTAIPPGTWEQA